MEKDINIAQNFIISNPLAQNSSRDATNDATND